MLDMINCYTFEDVHPVFVDREIVTVDTRKLGLSLGLVPGQIVGRSVCGLIDIWMVEFQTDFGPTYPYRVVSVPHTMIIKK
jgi:hypothetical protein